MCLFFSCFSVFSQTEYILSVIKIPVVTISFNFLYDDNNIVDIPYKNNNDDNENNNNVNQNVTLKVNA